MKILLIPCFIFCAAALPASDIPPESYKAMSLKEARSLALIRNASLIQESLESQEARRQLRLQRRFFFPAVELGYSRYDAVFPGGPDSRIDKLSLGITQLLYSGGRERSAYRTARRALQIRDLLFYRREEEILYQVTMSFVDVLKYRRILKIQEQSCENLYRQLDIAAMEFKLGEIRRLDYLDMRLAAAEYFLKLDDTKEALRRSRYQLSDLLFLPMEELPRLGGRLNENFRGYFINEAETEVLVKGLLALAEENNGSLMKLKQEELSARESLNESRLGWLPRIEVSADFSFSGQEYPLREPSFSLGLNFQFDLPLLPASMDLQAGQAGREEYNRTTAFSTDLAGNTENPGDIRSARSILFLKQMDIETALRSLNYQISSLIEEIRVTREKILIQKDNISLLEEKLKIQDAELELGQITRLIYMESRLDLADQRIVLLENLVDLYQKEEELIQLCGSSTGFPRTEGLIDE